MPRFIPLILFVLTPAKPALGQGGAATPAPDGGSGSTALSEVRRQPAGQSEAERIARLRRAIEDSEGRLAELKAALADPRGEFSRAEEEFKQLDRQRDSRGKEQERKAGAGVPPATSPDDEAVEKRWKLAKDRFDLAIQERKVLREQIAALERKLSQDREALERILSPPAPATQPAARAGAEPGPGAPATQPAAVSAPSRKSTLPGLVPGAAAGLTDLSNVAPKGPVASPSAGPPAAPRKEVLQAQREAQAKESTAREAEDELASVGERIEALRTSIALEQKLLETARKKAANAQETQQTLSEQLRKASMAGGPATTLHELWEKITEAGRRISEAQKEVSERVDHLDRLRAEVQQLQSEHIAALEKAAQKRREAEAARKRVETLEDPLAPQNLWNWLVFRGPRILGILAGMAALLWLARSLGNRTVRLLVLRAERGTPEERENRARTVASVLHNAVYVAVIVGGVLMILTEISVNIMPILGGAAVVGLAVAFGAQNLIRDYFSGFMILLENQYGINDVVRVGDIRGQVERITLRITVLRDLEGVVHFIPNGQITTVSNMTHGWSQALFDIGVGYRENVDEVMKVLLELARELRREEPYRGWILQDPEMLGVDRFGDSSVVVRFVIRTRPMRQWPVKRELLRRIKKKFDELGIEIPFPHRVVYHRAESGEDVPENGGARMR